MTLKTYYISSTTVLLLLGYQNASFCENNHITFVFFWQVFIICYVTKATPFHFINDKCHIKKLKSYRNSLTGYYRCISLELPLGTGIHSHTCIHTHMCMHVHTYKHTNLLDKTISIITYHFNNSTVFILFRL